MGKVVYWQTHHVNLEEEILIDMQVKICYLRKPNKLFNIFWDKKDFPIFSKDEKESLHGLQGIIKLKLWRILLNKITSKWGRPSPMSSVLVDVDESRDDFLGDTEIFI